MSPRWRCALAGLALVLAACGAAAPRESAPGCDPLLGAVGDLQSKGKLPPYIKRDGRVSGRFANSGPICGGHCCAESKEVTLRAKVRRDLETLLTHHARSLHGLLDTTAVTFHNHVLELAKQSENSTHYLFSQVYNRMSVLSREPISALYADIKSYVNKTGEADLNIEESIKNFFTNLSPLVYHHVLEFPSRDFSEDYKACLKRKIDYIQPFGNIPVDMSRSIYRSLEATRLLLQALALGSEVLNTTDALLAEEAEKANSSSSCNTALMKMTYCPKCLGMDSQVKPCFGYCLNVLRGCLSQRIIDMDIPWNSYVETLEKLVIEVKTHATVYNVDSVIRGLEHKLSDAIMYALEHGPNLLKKVKWACGAARFTDTGDSPRVAAGDSGSTSGRPPPTPRSTLIPPADVQVYHFLASVATSKGYFSNLADTLCNDDTFAVQQDEKECWNGERIGEYTKTVSRAGNQKYNPEVVIPSDGMSSVSPIVDSRVEKLSERLKHMRELILKHLNPAYSTSENTMQGDEADAEFNGSGSGKETDDWSDDEEPYESPEGSGSGIGGIVEHTNVHVTKEVSGNPADNEVISYSGGEITRISTKVLLSIGSLFILIQSHIRNFNVLL